MVCHSRIGGAVDEPKIGTFNIVDNSYQFEIGMTWEQFVQSKYNTDNNYRIVGNNVHSGSGTYEYAIAYGSNHDYNRVLKDDYIINGERYGTTKA